MVRAIQGYEHESERDFCLGSGVSTWWKLLSQRLDMEANPFELHLEAGAGRGAKYPCPACGSGLVREAYMGGNIYYCPVCQPI